MNLQWQNAAVLVVVVAAIGYLARGAWQTLARRKAAGCGSCGTCPAGDPTPRVVGIEPLLPNAVAAERTTGGPDSRLPRDG
jgi:hypothetical protein